MDKIKQQFLPLILSVSILSLLATYFIFASFTNAPGSPAECPAGYPGCDAPLNVGPVDQTKSGGLIVDTLTTSGGILYLDDSTEGNIERVDKVVGYNGLILKSNPDGNKPIHISGSQLNFYSNGLKWQIDSTGTLTEGYVPWARLTDFPSESICPENQYAVGINEDGTFKCGVFIDSYSCEILHKCAVYNEEEGMCEPKDIGEYDLPACQKCDGESLDPVYYEINTYDTTDPNRCDENFGDGECYACNANGYCGFQASFQISGLDISDQCDENSGCLTGNCSGIGNFCGYYTNGQHDCGSCKKCDFDGNCVNQASDEDLGNDCSESGCYTGYCNGSGSCGYQDSDEDLWDACPTSGCNTGYCSGIGNSCGTYSCPVCHECLGDGESCDPVTTNWGANSYGCEGDNKRCYNGSCKICAVSGTTAGYLYSDGCNGCAGQGGKACWRVSFTPPGEKSCNETCSSFGGCVNANWNDDENWGVCYAYNPGADGYMTTSEGWAPGGGIASPGDIDRCIKREGGTNQDCSAEFPIIEGEFGQRLTAGNRFCVCQY